MATEFNYTLEEVDATQLQVEINNNSGFTATCTAVNWVQPDQLEIVFNTDLSGNEESLLDTVVANHDPEAELFDIRTLPINTALGGKVAVHSSPKPEIEGLETFVVWSGCGDDVTDPENPILGEGDLLNFQMTIGTPSVSKDIIWSQEHFGRVWIHEGYLKFSDAGNGDHITATIIAKPTQLQTMANLDLELYDTKWIKYAAGGPGTGTHGFAATPVLIPRGYSKDGDWDWNGANLTPNMTGTGGYKMSTEEEVAHKYINRIPCYGDCSTYFMMSSDETAEIRDGYFLRITCYNTSNTNWQASVIMEIYRERTTS